MAGGKIIYNGISILFPRRWNEFNVRNAVNNSSVQAASGVEQVVNFFDQDFITATKTLETGQIQDEINAFYEYARDGSSFSIEEDRDIGTYISFEGGGNSATVPTIAPRGLQTNDKTAGTFTKTEVADASWYLDPSTGLMTVIPTTDNIPRFPAGKYGRGIQIDGAATNLITRPSVFDNAAWSKVSVTVAADTTETLDPAGANNSDKLTSSSANATASFFTGTAPGNNATGAVWLKSSTGTIAITLKIEGASSGSTTAAISVTPKWQRFSVTADTSGFVGDIVFVISIDLNTQVIYAWGAGLYDNAAFDRGTIGALSTTSVTMNAETLKFPSVNILNKDKGTVSFWIKPEWDPTFGITNEFFTLFESGDSAGGATNLHISFQFDRFGGDRLKLRVFRDNNANVGVQWVPLIATGMIKNTWAHLVFTWDATISNSAHIYVNGAELQTGSTNDSFNVSETYDTIAFGTKNFNNEPASAIYDDIFISKSTWDATQVKHVFNKGRGLGVKRNRWTSVRLANPNNNIVRRMGDRVDLKLEMKEILT